MNNPLAQANIDPILAFQNTAAWADLMACARAQLPAFATVKDIPDVAAAAAHRRAGAEEMLDLLLWLPRQPKETPGQAAPAPLAVPVMDMSDDPQGFEPPPQYD